MSREQVTLLNRGFIGSGALIAAMLLVSFYLVVSSVVTRAEQRRGEWNDRAQESRGSATAPPIRSQR